MSPKASETLPDSVGYVNYVSNTDQVNILKYNASYRAEKDINLTHFKELMTVFRMYSDPLKGTLDASTFKLAFARVLGAGLDDRQMTILFMQIDSNTDGEIDWNDFSTYMLLRAQGAKQMREVYFALKQEQDVKLFERAKYLHTPHLDTIIRVQYLTLSGKYMVCSRDGTVTYWNDSFKRVKTCIYAGQLPAMRLIIEKTHKGMMRWVHDAIMMENFSKIVFATDDHCITVVDSATLEVIVCLDLQSSNPMSLDYYYDSKMSLLVYGTDQGFANAFYLNADKLNSISVRPGMEYDIVLIESENQAKRGHCQWGTLLKKKAHSDWVMKVIYVPSFKAIVSVSADINDSLSINLPEIPSASQNVSISKGVNCVAFCKSPVCLITGGGDRQLRIWNPHRLNTAVALEGHHTSITSITVNDLHGQCISLSIDNEVRVWDLRTTQCLQTFTHINHRNEGFTTLYFNPIRSTIILGSKGLQHYKLHSKVVTASNSHDFSIRSILYNDVFKTIVSGCDGGVVNVWVTAHNLGSIDGPANVSVWRDTWNVGTHRHVI